MWREERDSIGIQKRSYSNDFAIHWIPFFSSLLPIWMHSVLLLQQNYAHCLPVGNFLLFPSPLSVSLWISFTFGNPYATNYILSNLFAANAAEGFLLFLFDLRFETLPLSLPPLRERVKYDPLSLPVQHLTHTSDSQSVCEERERVRQRDGYREWSN